MDQYTADIYDYEVGRLIHRLISFLGENEIEKRLRKYHDALQSGGPVFRKYYLQTRHPWWASLDEFFALEQAGKSIKRHLSRSLKLLAGDARVITILNRFMPENVRRKYRQDLMDDERAKDYLFELHIAWHFHLMGCTIEWLTNDAVKHSEFLVKSESLEFLVECKRVSIDLSRKIRRRDFYRLAEKLLPSVQSLGFCGIVNITLSGRLHSNDNYISDLCSQVLRKLDIGSHNFVIQSGRFSSSLQSANHIAVDLVAKTRELITIKPPEAHGAIFVGSSLGKPVDSVTLIIQSEAAEPVLEGIKDRLKKAASQLDPSYPGLIACFLEGIDDLTELASDSGLQVISNYLLDKHEFAHVAAISYCSESKVEETSRFESFFNQGLLFRNPNCKFSGVSKFHFLR